MINENFNVLGGIIVIACGVGYIREALRGRIQPNRVSWFLWALAPLIAFAAQITQGVGWQSIIALSIGINSLIVFLSSFVNKKAYWKIERLDIICGILSGIGLILWYVTRVGNYAILFSIFSDFAASIPTTVKAYKIPESESSNVFFGNTISAVITMLTIRDWNFQTYGFPLYILLMMGFIAILIELKIGKIISKFVN